MGNRRHACVLGAIALLGLCILYFDLARVASSRPVWEYDSETNANMDETNANKDDGETNANMDDGETNTDMDGGETNANKDDGEANANMDDGETNTNLDDGETSTDDGETNTNINTGDGETNGSLTPAPDLPQRCPPPVRSIRVALVGNEYMQQLPLIGYGGIESAVENLAKGVAGYMANKGEYGEWCANGWVEIKEFMAVVPRRSQKTDLNGNPYPFRVLETEGVPRTSTSVWIGQVKQILEKERPDVIWSQSGWSADGLKSLGIPIICTIHDRFDLGNGAKGFSFGYGDDKNMLHYRFVSEHQRERWATSDAERAISSFLWQGLAESEYVLGDPANRGYFLYVSGRWGREKGIDEVLELARLNPDAQFRVYGSSDLEGELQEFARSHYNFHYEPDLKRGKEHENAFTHARGLLMFTHLPEAFGRVTIEALAKGTPVFGTRNGANPELITPDVGFISNDLNEVNAHLHDKFNHTHIYELARRRHHVEVEVRGMLAITRDMLLKKM